MYTEFLLSGLNVKDVGQAFIDKCRQRMPLAILGKCSIKETLAGFILPSAYTGVYAVNYNNTPHSRDSEEILHSW